MLRISLVNMPFADPRLPSIALTQLRSVVEDRFGDGVRVRILYLNQDFGRLLGADLYGRMVSAVDANSSGLGDWFFRQVAFPEETDNTQAYFQRYFPHSREEVARLRGELVARRAQLPVQLRRLADSVRLEEEDLVGFTSMFSQTVASIAMARQLKERNPGLVTVIGGANCESPMGEELARHVGVLDYVFSGPGLVSFPELVAALLAGDADACRRIPGVLCRDNLGSEDLQGRGAIGRELPIQVPVRLDYDSFLEAVEKNFPGGEIEPSLTFETSRGCWWGERSHCTFCGLNGSTMAYRAMAPEQARELLHGLFERYGERVKRYESVDNILPREYVEGLFADFSAPPGTRLFYEVKADLKTPELERLSQAGVTELQPGIEALATSTLKLMGKGTTAHQNLVFLKNCDRFGISPAWNLLIGFPGEDEEVYRRYVEILPRLFHLPPPGGAFPVRFDRYSPYFVRAEEFGLQLEPYEFYRFVYPFPASSLKHLAYYFEDRNYAARYLSQVVRWQEKLTTLVDRWWARREGRDGNEKARLELVAVEDEGASVLDSRAGERVEHPLSPLDLQILDTVAAKGRRRQDIARRLELDEKPVSAAVDQLLELGLLFEEAERLVSLVLEPAGALETADAATAAWSRPPYGESAAL